MRVLPPRPYASDGSRRVPPLTAAEPTERDVRSARTHRSGSLRNLDYSVVMQPQPRGLTWLWIVLGAVAVLLVVCGVAGAVVLPRFGAHLFSARTARTTAHPAGNTASAGASGPACSYQAAPEGAPLTRR